MDWEVGANRESRAEGGEANDNFLEDETTWDL